MNSKERNYWNDKSLRNGKRYYHLRNLSKAIDFFSLILEKEPQQVIAYLYRSMCYLEILDTYKAQTDLGTIIRLSQNSAEAYFARAIIGELNFENQHTTIQYFTEAIRLDASLTPAYEYRGMEYVGIGDIERSIDDFNVCLEKEPENGTVLLLRARSLRLNRRFRASIRDLEAYLDLFPNTTMKERLCREIASIWWALSGIAAREREQNLRPKSHVWEND